MARSVLKKWGMVFVAILCLLFVSDIASTGVVRDSVKINGYEIDVTGEEPAVPQEMEPQRNGKFKKWIVQFTGPIHEDQKKQLGDLGCRIGDYLPEFAFIVTMTDKNRNKVKALSFINGVVRLKPAYKIHKKFKDESGALTLKKGNAVTLNVRVDGADNLPVLLSAVLKSKGKVLHAGSDVARVSIDGADIIRLSQIEEVLWIEEAVPMELLNDTSKWVIQTNELDSTRLWDQGLHGEGQIVGVGDTGLDYDMPWFRDPAGTAIGPTHRKIVGYDTTYGDDYDADESGHGTHVSGTVGGDRTPVDGLSNANGMAPKARIFLQDLTPGSSRYVYPPADLGEMFITAYDAGARIHTNSWGSAVNTYGTMSASVDRFLWEHQDFLAVFSNGNSGPSENTVGTPATAKNVISVGATENGTSAEQVAGFSSNGTTADGRIKPTVSAPGVDIISADSDGLQDSFNSGTRSMSGTSMAAPTTAGAAALVRQYYTKGYYPSGAANPADAFNPSGALVKATIVNSAQGMTGSYTDGPIPATGQGWGRINLSNTLRFSGDAALLDVVDNSAGLATGEDWSWPYYSTGDKPLKVTLVWTDYPGSPSASKALVNDLDLTVTAPDGTTTYLGNVFTDGESAAGGSADRLNVEEQVLIKNPQQGSYTVTVSAYNVPNGPQPFALVVTGASGVSSRGFITLDRGLYNASGKVSVKVGDTDLNLDNTVVEQLSVIVSSTAEPEGESVTLTETGPTTAVFIGTIPLSDAPPSGGNGSLEIVDGDTVTATYEDGDDGTGSPATVTATARIDTTPPVISAVAAGEVGEDRATVSWTTSEPGDSLIRYGETTARGIRQAGPAFKTAHALTLTNLGEGKTYYYDVSSSDEAGNTAVDDNTGSFHTFVTAQLPPSLSVYSSNGSETMLDYTILFGIAADPSGVATVSVNGNAASYRSSDGYYELTVSLVPGTNLLTVEAADAWGNAKTLTITVNRVEPPDLLMKTVSGPASGLTQGTIDVADTVSNAGIGDASGFTVTYYLSPDSEITPSDISIGGRHVPSLIAGADSSGTTPILLSSAIAPGMYYLGAIADGYDDQYESDETNNGLTGNQIRIDGPDLTISAVSNPATGVNGGTVAVSYTLLNNGPAATGSFSTGIYLSADNVITASDRLLTSQYTSTLASGASLPVSTTVTIPGYIDGGTYVIGVIADRYDNAKESDETNNALAGSPIEIMNPDLTVTAVSSPVQGLTAGTLTVSDTVTADATGGAAGAFSVGIYLSTDSVISSSDMRLGSRAITGLDPGESNTADTIVTLPGNLAGGTYYVGAIADYEARIQESDEANNARVGNAVEVTASDLTMTAVSGPASGVTGGTITVMNTVTAAAQGGGATGVRVYFYLSDDAVVTTSDKYLGSRYIGGLAPGASSTESSWVTVSSSREAGTYYIGAIADPYNDVNETDETNNALAGNQIALTNPDLQMISVSGPASALTGENMAVQYTVAAAGASDGRVSSFSIGIYLSTDSTITSADTLIQSFSLAGISLGTTVTGEKSIALSDNLDGGTYYIGAIADYNNSAREYDESNNAVAGNQVAITGPDLTLSAISGPASGSSGGQIAVQDTVTASAAGGGALPFYITYYLSKDNDITTSDTYLGIRRVGGLAPGASDTDTTTVTIPTDVENTSYYIGAIADRYNEVQESDETNNILAGNRILIVNPDLAMSTVSGPASGMSGGSIAVSNTVVNIGPGAVAQFFVGIYLSPDESITADDTRIGSRTVNGLGPGMSMRDDTVVTIPPAMISGTYYVGAIADHGDSINEADESNNALAGNQVTVINPDLTMTAVSGPGSAKNGEKVTISSTVANTSTAFAAGFSVGLYLSSDNTITTADTRIGSRYVSGLAAGEASTADTSVTIPTNRPAGAYTIGAIADYSNSVAESDETNNAVTGGQLEVVGPDLTMGLVSGPTSSYNGATITVRNTAVALPAGGRSPGFYVHLYLSSDNVITTSDTFLDSRYVSGLASGASNTAETTVTIPGSVTGGVYTLGAIVDPWNYIKEIDETNNALAGNQLEIKNPDLTVTAVSGPASGRTNVEFTVSTTVAASPEGGSAAGFQVGIYLSTDAVITPSDTRIGYRSVEGLAPGASSTADTVVTIPSTVAEGTYSIGAIADYYDTVEETDETNNALAGNPITIVGPDLTMTAVSGPASGLTARSVTVSNTVTAAANGGGTSGFYVGIYLSTDDVITSADRRLETRYVSGLGPGESNTADTVVTIPSTIPGGTYYIGAIADYSNYIDETNEVNNSLAGNSMEIIGPDLAMSAVSAPPSARAGEEATVSNTVTAAAAGGGSFGFYVGIYLSTDSVITTSDTRLGSRYVSSLAPGASDTADSLVTIPNSIAGGTYYIGAIADTSNAITESDETNNELAGNQVEVLLPDLTMSSVQCPPRVTTGSPVTVSNSVAAAAAGGSAQGFYVGIYLSEDSSITTADKRIGERYISALAAGATDAADTTVTIPSTVASGMYYVGTIADYSDWITESDEENNAITGNQVDVAGPDLSISEVSGPARGFTNSTITVRNTVTAAPDSGNAGGFYVGIYLSTDTIITTDDKRIGYRYVSSLAAGDANSEDTVITLSSSLEAGTYSIGAIADTSSSVTESDETNNAHVGNQITIVGPDLTASAVSGPVRVITGSAMNVATTVTAAADGASSTGFYVNIYLSEDSVITTSDYSLGSRYVTSLGAGESNTADISVTIPTSFASGTYYIGMIADGYNYVKESNETNNALAGNQITVVGPDLTMTTVSGPASGVYGQTVTVTNTVTAAADGGPPDYFLVGIYISKDNIITTDDVYVGGRYVYDLAPGSSSTMDTSITIPSTLKRGTYYLGAIADYNNYVGEYDEQNNALAGNEIMITRK